MRASPHVSLIFVNYRSADYLANALKSLLACEPETDFWEVIVVNNDVSENQTLLKLQQTFPFLLVESGANAGFARGNNLGAKRARGEILGFINPDVIWTNARLNEIAYAFDTDRTLGVLGMTLLDEDKKLEAWSAGQEPSLINLFYNNLFPSRRILKKAEKVSSPDWVSGGALFVRAEIFSASGGFDERFFLYFEDVDLCASVRRLGFSVKRYAALSLIHLSGKSQNSTHDQKKHFFESQRKYFNKHRPKWERWALNYLQILLNKT